MNATTDQTLLQEFVREASEEAFGELIRRHVDLVYSTALRVIRSPDLANDVTQQTFTALAQNARRLASRAVLAGWLHETARNFAISTIRSEERRRLREKDAAMLAQSPSDSAPRMWDQITLHLDAALAQIREADRDVVILRYFEGKTAKQAAQQLGISEEAAQKRVERAIERLRRVFAQRGIALPGTTLASLIATEAVHSAPAGVAASLMATAAAGAGLLPPISTFELIKLMASTKMKAALTAIVVAAVSVPLTIQHRANARLKLELASVRDQSKETNSTGGDLFNSNSQELEQLRLEHGELLRLRGEMTGLRRDNDELKRLLAEKAGASGRADDTSQQSEAEDETAYVQSDSWADVGLARPEETVQTWLWAARDGNAQRWAEASGRSADGVAEVGWRREMLEVKSARIKLPDAALMEEATISVDYKLHSGAVEHGFFRIKRWDNSWVISSVSGFPIRLFVAPARRAVQIEAAF
ncbi:MAG: sigma-70 family RNA polymerase sigma factor [Verrucomicrobiales bacterium]|nr:sigma-70 family RNA polymerase sigma factor [Verrucomicrobiales bacterium]